jgi:hypothetical protein
MTNTTEIRKLMRKASNKPSQKNIDRLVGLVYDLCDKYDADEPKVLDILHKNQESIETTFSFIKSLRGNNNAE